MREEWPIFYASLAFGSYAEEMCLIRQATPGYSKGDRRKVVLDNLKPFAHPYYAAYRDLQRLCLKILRREELKYGAKEDELHGILFDGAWLWEEYLAEILKPVFRHCRRGDGKPRDYLFRDEDGKPFQIIIPDFLSRDGGVVADAKYIPLDRDYRSLHGLRASKVYYKTLMYMLRYDTELGLLLYPRSSGEVRVKTLSIPLAGRKLLLVGFPIPSEASGYKDFSKAMQATEGRLFDVLNPFI